MLSREGLIRYYHQRGKWWNVAFAYLKSVLGDWQRLLFIIQRKLFKQSFLDAFYITCVSFMKTVWKILWKKNDDGHPNHFPNMYIDGQDVMLRRQQLMQLLPWTELFLIDFVQVVDNRNICTWHVYLNNNKGPWPTSVR